MKKLITTWWSNKSNVKLILAPALLIICNLFLFGPATIYSGNISEFNISLIDILKYYAVPGMIILLIFLGIGIALSKKYLSLYVALIFGVGVLLWVQGNILVWKYGLLDGQGIDWSQNVWRGWIDGALWIVLLVLACVFSRRVSKIAGLACVVLLSLQLVTLSYSAIYKPEIWKEKKLPAPVSAPKEIFEFSSSKNVIHIMLDAFQSDLFEEIIATDPSYYKSGMDGFTFFREATGAFATTYMSVPATFSGKYYRNHVPMKEFVKRTLNGKTIVNALYGNGYDVDLVHIASMYAQGLYSNIYFIPMAYGGNKRQDEKANSALMMDLALFRLTPHFIKKLIYNNQLWMIQSLFGSQKGSGFIQLSHKAFLEDLIANMDVKRQKPVYKFIHLVTTHPPNIMNEDCEFSGKVLPYTREYFLIQDKCALNDIIGFLDRLKSLGIYDTSLIILQADTGVGLPVKKMRNYGPQIKGRCPPNLIGNALPLLVIKPPYSKGPLKISNAQVMLTDIPATISSVLALNDDFPGDSVFQVNPDENRERRYYHYKWRHEHWQAEYLPILHEYLIKGSVFDGDSWSIGLRYLQPSLHGSFLTRKIGFGTPSASKFLLDGWSSDEKDSKEGLTFNWALGNSASIFLSLPKDEVVVLTANVKTLKFVKPQRVTIKVDGKEIGMWEIGSAWKWEKHSIVIEPDEHRPDVSVVDFVFSEYYEPDERVKRPLAVLFESITLNKAGYLYKRDRSVPPGPSDNVISVDRLALSKLTFRNSGGFGPLEGPYPKWHMPRKVRWMVAPEASVNLEGEPKSDTSYSLHISVLSQAVPQSLKVLLNGVTILEETIDSANQWYALNTEGVNLRAGENILKFQASAFKRYPESRKDLYVLFDALAFQLDEPAR